MKPQLKEGGTSSARHRQKTDLRQANSGRADRISHTGITRSAFALFSEETEMELDFRALERAAFSVVVAFAVILLAIVIQGKYPGLSSRFDDGMVPHTGNLPMCVFSAETFARDTSFACTAFD
ncbi:hypothetical protein QYH69_06225 [Paraburkholderia sp. SARCC-3016]|uniref:hypothetical protein n=1 Tax=Paraburkholderia sp. SARCC-3016 TaxID=3058611 RepID=UPI002809AC3F|nr:hypothetical protein [Paraburkholderia sp. SARCC-3016]MDQ7976838.1 hypothetical protein [Paraburkholderia sp. SARCC-3016]